MPVVAALPAIASVVSAGSGIYSALKGGNGTSVSGGGGSVPTGYQPTGQGAADQQYQSLLQSLYGSAASLPGQIAPAAGAYTQALMNNPYSGQSMDWAQGLAGLGQQVSGQQQAGSQQAYGYAPNILNSALGYGDQVMQTAFDPQSQLHDYSSTMNLDRQNAINAQNGVAGTPYGAGLAGDASRNFEMDWLNQQLGRQVQGAGAYQGLLGAGTSAYQGLMGLGSSLGNQSLQSSAATGNLPYQTYMGQNQDLMAALNGLSSTIGGAQAPATDLMSALGNYLGFGQNATRTAQTGQNTGFNQSQTQGAQLGQTIGGGSLGKSLQGLAGIFSGGQQQPIAFPTYDPGMTTVPANYGLSTDLPSFSFG